MSSREEDGLIELIAMAVTVLQVSLIFAACEGSIYWAWCFLPIPGSAAAIFVAVIVHLELRTQWRRGRKTGATQAVGDGPQCELCHGTQIEDFGGLEVTPEQDEVIKAGSAAVEAAATLEQATLAFRRMAAALEQVPEGKRPVRLLRCTWCGHWWKP